MLISISDNDDSSLGVKVRLARNVGRWLEGIDHDYDM